MSSKQNKHSLDERLYTLPLCLGTGSESGSQSDTQLRNRMQKTTKRRLNKSRLLGVKAKTLGADGFEISIPFRSHIVVRWLKPPP